jgi:hypothetical protein
LPDLGPVILAAGRFDFEVRRYRQVYEKFGQSQFGVAAKTFCYPARGNF